MNKKLKTTDIKGKPYVEVNERLRYFRETYPGHALISKIHELTPEYCVITACVLDANGLTLATGTAREVNGDSFINKTSYVENCETSAWGRALGCFGIGIGGSVASAEEVGNAILNQKTAKKTDINPLPGVTVTTADDGPPAEPQINDIVEQAFWNFEIVYKDSLAKGFHYSKTKLYQVIEQKNGHLPDVEDPKVIKADAIKWILDNVGPREIMEQDKE